MSILDKIEEVRKKPEYIRLRYVWAGVFISMIFVVIIWIFSFKLTVRPVKIENQGVDNLKKNVEDAKNQMPSLEEMFKGTELEQPTDSGQPENAPNTINPNPEDPGSSPVGNEIQPPAGNSAPLEQEGIMPDNNQR